MPCDLEAIAKRVEAKPDCCLLEREMVLGGSALGQRSHLPQVKKLRLSYGERLGEELYVMVCSLWEYESWEDVM